MACNIPMFMKRKPGDAHGDRRGMRDTDVLVSGQQTSKFSGVGINE